MTAAMWKWTSAKHESAMPDTVMARAFLDGVIRWAERQAGVGRVAIPTGQVSSEELRQVVLALACARRTK